MNILYWDCFSGIAGNMAVASLLDLGASREKLSRGLQSIPFMEGPVELIIEEKIVNGIRGIYFNTHDDEALHKHSHAEDHQHTHENAHAHDHDHAHEHAHDHGHDHDHTHCHEDHENLDLHENSIGHSHCQHIHHGPEKMAHHSHGHAPHRGLKEISELIGLAQISSGARKMALDCFKVLAEAEATIHGKSVDEVHFHEVGARDSIADIVGVAICLDDLHVKKIVVSPVHLGSGMVKCAHGIMPVPAPATALLLKGLPVVFDYNIRFELTTPTGAAILKGLAAQPQTDGQVTFGRVGHGHGSLDIGQANFLRAFLSEPEMIKKNIDSIVVLETNIDNATGEVLGHAVDELIRLGALDVCLIPVLMKKGRPGHIVQIQVSDEKAACIEQAIFDLLPTLGLRKRIMERTVLGREAITVSSEFGDLAGKKTLESDGTHTEKIEFDEIVRVANEQKTTPRKLLNKLEHRKKKN